jgi:hypothetical protein
MARATVGTLRLKVKRSDPARAYDYGIARDLFAWAVTNTDTGETVTGADLSGPSGTTALEMLPSLVSFLSADGETFAHYGGATPPDGYLFVDQVAEWAYMNSDELSLFGIDSEDGAV